MSTNIYSGHHYVLHTDGACRGNPGPGGWGVVIHEFNDDNLISRHALAGRAKGITTNNIMELTAALESLRLLPKAVPAIVVSESDYLVKGMNEWRHSWKKNGWRKSNRKAVDNQGFWMSLDGITQSRPVTFQWVRGHNGPPLNEAADMLASNAAAGWYALTPPSELHPELFV